MERNRKPILSAFVICGVALTIAACNGNRADNTTQAADVGYSPNNNVSSQPAPLPQRSSPLDDAVIFDILDEIHDSEADLAKVARNRATNAEVRAFAQDMITAHDRMEDAAEKLAKRLNIDPNSAASDSLDRAYDQIEDRLESMAKGAPEFDTAYINAEATTLQHILSFVKSATEMAKSPDLKTLLASTEKEIQQQLNRAKALQAKL